MSATLIAGLLGQCNAQPKSPTAPAWFRSAAYAAFISHRVPPPTALKYSTIYLQSYIYVQGHPQLAVSMSASRLTTALGYAFSGATIAGDAVGAIRSGSTVDRLITADGVAGLVNVIVLVLNSEGIKTNECAVSVAAVSADLATMAAGGATAWTGVGVVLASIGLAFTIIDMNRLAQTCGPA